MGRLVDICRAYELARREVRLVDEWLGAHEPAGEEMAVQSMTCGEWTKFRPYTDAQVEEMQWWVRGDGEMSDGLLSLAKRYVNGRLPLLKLQREVVNEVFGDDPSEFALMVNALTVAYVARDIKQKELRARLRELVKRAQ